MTTRFSTFVSISSFSAIMFDSIVDDIVPTAGS